MENLPVRWVCRRGYAVFMIRGPASTAHRAACLSFPPHSAAGLPIHNQAM